MVLCTVYNNLLCLDKVYSVFVIIVKEYTIDLENFGVKKSYSSYFNEIKEYNIFYYEIFTFK